MWKVVAIVLAVFVLGHFLVRYVRKNPLDPVIQGAEIAVESQDYAVHFLRSGQVAGTYFVSAVESKDWTSRPVNARLYVYGLQTGTEYTRTYADFHLYGSDSSTRLEPIATPLSVIAADRKTYGDLWALKDRWEDRANASGERLCVTLSGEALALSAAESLEDGHDVTAMFTGSNEDPIVYVDKLEFADCKNVLAAAPR